MYYLDRLFGGGVTDVWISREASKFLAKQGKRHGQTIAELLEKTRFWAANGFVTYEGGPGCPIKHEGDGVYRIGLRASLFRLIGFYENDDKQTFLIVDAFFKAGTKNRMNERDRIHHVGLVKKGGAGVYRKVLAE